MNAPSPAPAARPRRLVSQLAVLTTAYFVLFAVVLSASAFLGLRSRTDRERSRQTYTPASVEVRNVLAAAIDQETAERGYVITGQRRFLEPYTSGQQRAQRGLDQLDHLLRHDSEARAQVVALGNSISAWRTGSAELEIKAVDDGRRADAAALTAQGKGKALFDEVRNTQATLAKTIDDRLATLRERVTHESNLLLVVLFGGSAIALGLALAARRWLRGVALERERAIDALAVSERVNRTVADLLIAIAPATNSSELVEALDQTVKRAFDADAVMLGVVDPDDEVVRFGATAEVEEQVLAEWSTVSLSVDIPATEVVRTGVLAVIDRTKVAAGRPHAMPLLDAARAQVGVYVPLVAGATVVGVLGVFFREQRAVDELERDLLVNVGRVLGEAIERLRLFEFEQSVASTLQHAMLPIVAVQETDEQVATRYQPAVEALDIGGDWFDVFHVDDHRVGLVVGDVVGHGLEAAAIMGQLRSALAAAALADPDPAAALGTLDHFARSLPGAVSATVAYALVDRDEGTLSYHCAGHPPPLVVEPDGTFTYLDDSRTPPLAIGRRGPRATGVTKLQPDAIVVLYTDGLIERRHESLDTGLARLSDAVCARVHAPVEELCDEVLDELVGVSARRDDVALVAYRFACGRSDTFLRRLPAQAASLARFRHDLASWFTEQHVPDAVASELLVASGEAAMNAVEHAFRGVPVGVVTVEAAIGNGEVSVYVRDDGLWRSGPSATNRGHGITIMHALTSDARVWIGERGTKVRLTRTLEHTRT